MSETEEAVTAEPIKTEDETTELEETEEKTELDSEVKTELESEEKTADVVKSEAKVENLVDQSNQAVEQTPYDARLSEAPTKGTIPILLHPRVIASCQVSISKRGAFTIGISGGSVPGFLSTLPSSFDKAGITPKWDKWHVFLADERFVSSDHEDSNMKNIIDKFLGQVPIPKEQIYSIDEGFNTLDTPADVAEWYDKTVVKPLLEKSKGKLDCLLLGFGPDGHTCSLFPNHPLLSLDSDALVASIEDSPKPPSQRITLTMKALNECFRNIIFCASGTSKYDVVKNLWEVDEDRCSLVHYKNPPPYPCVMVRPIDGQVTWVLDKDAVKGESLEKKEMEE